MGGSGTGNGNVLTAQDFLTVYDGTIIHTEIVAGRYGAL